MTKTPRNVGVKRPTSHNPMVFRKTERPQGRECLTCGQYIRATLETEPCEGCEIQAWFDAGCPE